MTFLKCITNCINIVKSPNNIRFNYPCQNSSSCSPIEIYLARGLYYIDLFGASGGGNESISESLKPGYGGRAAGFFKVQKLQKYFLYIGGEGATGNEEAKGGWNGGGSGAPGFKTDDIFGGGGGGTDIRISSNEKDRIAVAGGGGGCGRDSASLTWDTHGGNGGGLKGDDGGVGLAQMRQGLGGTQTKGGKGGYATENGSAAQNGTILQGGNGLSLGGSNAGGGGGGYFGGGGAYESGGGGGSSYIDKLINGTTTSGVNKGNGYIIITPFYIDQCTFRTRITIRPLLLFIFVSLCS